MENSPGTAFGNKVVDRLQVLYAGPRYDARLFFTSIASGLWDLQPFHQRVLLKHSHLHAYACTTTQISEGSYSPHTRGEKSSKHMTYPGPKIYPVFTCNMTEPPHLIFIYLFISVISSDIASERSFYSVQQFHHFSLIFSCYIYSLSYCDCDVFAKFDFKLS